MLGGIAKRLHSKLWVLRRLLLSPRHGLWWKTFLLVIRPPVMPQFLGFLHRKFLLKVFGTNRTSHFSLFPLFGLRMRRLKKLADSKRTALEGCGCAPTRDIASAPSAYFETSQELQNCIDCIVWVFKTCIVCITVCIVCIVWVLKTCIVCIIVCIF